MNKELDRIKAEKTTVFYVNPMSYSNLALYDYSLISNINNVDLQYFCNVKYDSNKLAVKCNKIYKYSDKTGSLKVISYWISQFSLFRLIRYKRPLVVHFQWLKIPLLDYYLLKFIKQKGVKIVLTAHNVLPHGTGNKYRKIYRKIYKVASKIIVHSEITKMELSESLNISPEKVVVIPHGVLDIGKSIDLKVVESYIAKFKSELDLENKIVFSALGTINDYKGIDLIVDAWNFENISENNQLKLLIAGKGKHEKLTELSTSKNAFILNRFLLAEEFLALLKLTDFVLLPYKKISQSGILLTAIGEKKRVIVSNVGGLGDPFKFGNIGFILPELNAKELNLKIIDASLKVRKVPDESIWATIMEYYCWKNIGAATEKLYYRLKSENL